MNREKMKKSTSFWGVRLKEILGICVLAGLLISVAYTVFHGEEKGSSTMAQMSEMEQKVCAILQEIEGVGEASVIVCEEENEVKSVVVVCEGARDLRVVMDIREAVSAALNTEQKSVKIYLKKD